MPVPPPPPPLTPVSEQDAASASLQPADGKGLDLKGEAKIEVDQVLEAIIYLYTESRRITKELARRADLTGPQLTVIKMLETFGDLSLSDLSDRIRAQNSTVTGIIDRMEREGLVARARSTEDRRKVHIKLTAKGRELAQEIPVEPMEIFRNALSGLSAGEVRDLLKILTKLARRVQAIVRHDRHLAGETPKSDPKNDR